MLLRSWISLLALVGSCVIAFPPAACFAQGSDAESSDADEVEAVPEGYDRAIDAALAEFGAGRWREARALFREAHGLFPNARTMRGMGMASFELREYAVALGELEAALTEPARPLTEEQRAQVEELLARTRSFVGRYVVPAAADGTRLFVDGGPADIDATWPGDSAPLVLALGTHTVEMRAPDGRSASVRVEVIGHAESTLELALPEPEPEPEPAEGPPPPVVVYVTPPPPAPGPDPAPFVVLGSGLAVAVAGGILLGAGWADIEAVQAGGRDWVDLQEAYHRAPILTGLGGTLLTVGLGASAVGVIWAIVDGEARDGADAGADQGGGVALRLGPGGVSVEGSF